MNILLPILIASSPVTADFPCWEVINGQVVDLSYLCQEEEIPPELNEAAFLADVQGSISSPIGPAFLEQVNPVDDAQVYCEDLESGVSPEEWREGFEIGIDIGLFEISQSQGGLTEGEESLFRELAEEYESALSIYAPQYYCPEFSQT